MAWTGIAIAGAFAVSQACLPNGVLPIDMVIMFANGVAVAVYGPLIRAAGPRRGVLWSALALGMLGLTHPLWLLLDDVVLEPWAGGSIPAHNASMFLWTGLVFGIELVADLRTWRTVLIMVVATATSTAAMYYQRLWGPGASWTPHMIGFPAIFLHSGIALALFLPARREWLKRSPGECAGCGYDMRGLKAERCPECGRGAESGVGDEKAAR